VSWRTGNPHAFSLKAFVTLRCPFTLADTARSVPNLPRPGFTIALCWCPRLEAWLCARGEPIYDLPVPPGLPTAERSVSFSLVPRPWPPFHPVDVRQPLRPLSAPSAHSDPYACRLVPGRGSSLSYFMTRF